MKTVTFFKIKGLFLLVLLIITFLFLLLQPSSLATLFPSHRENLWNNFVKETATKNRMDTKAFWQMREFYDPGSFVFRREGLSKEKQTQLLQELSLPTSIQQNSLLFLAYNANHFSSFDSLVSTRSAALFPEVVSSLSKSYPPLAKGENYLIVQKDKNTAIIVFLASDKEMKQANGFFDYREKDVKLVKEKLWFDISEVKINLK